MPGKKVFLSFDHETDARYKDLLVSWDEDHYFDFRHHRFATVPASGSDSGKLRHATAVILGTCPRLLCLIGPETHKSPWVEWEIHKAIEYRKHLFAVKIDPANIAPPGLTQTNTRWIGLFTFSAIRSAIESPEY